MGLGEIGHLLSCQRDGTFCEGYDKRLTLKRTQTIMQGASHCDFDYTLRQGSQGVTTQIFAPGGYRFIPGVFQYSGGAAAEPGHAHRARHLPHSRSAGAGLPARRSHHQGARPAADGLLRLRAALPGALYRRGLPRLQRALRRRRWPMGHLRRRDQDQSGRAQQRLPRDRPAGRALVPCLHLHGPDRAADADLRRRRQRRSREGGASYRERTVRHGETSADAHAGEGAFSCWARWSGG